MTKDNVHRWRELGSVGGEREKDVEKGQRDPPPLKLLMKRGKRPGLFFVAMATSSPSPGMTMKTD